MSLNDNSVSLIKRANKVDGSILGAADLLYAHVDESNDATDHAVRFDVLAGALARLGTVYRVSDPAYGIDTTGATDGAAAFRALLTAASGNGTVLVDGNILCSSAITIPSNTTILQLDRFHTITFNWTAAATAQAHFINSDTTNGNTNIRLLGLNVIGAHDGTPWGASPSPVTGVLMRRATEVDIIGCRFYRVAGISIALQGVAHAQVQRNKVRQGGRDGITAWWYASGWNLHDIDISHNSIYEVGDDGIAVHASQSDNPNTNARPYDISIANNTIFGATQYYADGAGRGIIVEGCERFSITDNTISDTFASGIYVAKDPEAGSSSFRSRRFKVMDNTVHRAGQVGDVTQPRVGIRVVSSDNGSIRDNTVTDSYGIGIYTNDTTYVPVTENNLDACGTAITDFGIDMDGGSSDRNVLYSSCSKNTVANGMGGGIRMNYTHFSNCAGNVVVDNGNAGDGTATNGSGIILNGDTEFPGVEGNVTRDTRAGALRRQTHGIVVPNVGGTPVVILGENHGSGQPGNPIRIDNTSTVLVKRGNYESSTGSTNYDQDISGVKRFSGSGTPEGAITAPIGSTYNRTDGGASTCFYVKESGVSNTGWVAK